MYTLTSIIISAHNVSTIVYNVPGYFSRKKMINDLAANAGMMMKKEKLSFRYRTSAVTHNSFYNLH